MKNTTYQNLWDVAKEVLWWHSIAYIRKEESYKLNNLSSTFGSLEKEEKTKSKVSRRKEIIKIRAEINEIENRISIEKMIKTKSWFFEKMNKIDKPVARLTEKKEDTNY